MYACHRQADELLSDGTKEVKLCFATSPPCSVQPGSLQPVIELRAVQGAAVCHSALESKERIARTLQKGMHLHAFTMCNTITALETESPASGQRVLAASLWE